MQAMMEEVENDRLRAPQLEEVGSVEVIWVNSETRPEHGMH